MKWIINIEGGPRRVNHAAVCINDKIYSFGGYCSTEEYKDWDPIPVYVLNTSTLRWSTVNYTKRYVFPFQRYGHTTVAYGKKVYMWGGRNNAVACDTLSCFDTESLEWSEPNVTGMIPHAKDGHSACVIGNKMYIFGGFEYFTDQYSQEVHYINLDTMTCHFVNASGTAPSQRDFHTAVAVGDRMYVFGGRGNLNSSYNSQDEIYCNQLYYLDTTKDHWVLVNVQSFFPEGRRSHSSWFYKDHIYIFGGYNGNTETHYNDLLRYSIKTNCWQSLVVNGIPPCKRRRQACLLYKDKVFLFGGTSPCKVNEIAEESGDDNQEHLIDNSDLHVLDYAPSLLTLCVMIVLKHNLDTSTLPQDILYTIGIMTKPNRISRPINQSG